MRISCLGHRSIADRTPPSRHVLFLARWILLLLPILPSLAQGQTVTTLTLSAANVAAGTVVTLTATVRLYEAGPTVNPGLVNFCDATVAECTDVHLLGSAQLTTAGTATIRLTPKIGTHSYRAVFAGTNAHAGSASAASQLVVTGAYPTTTTIASSGNAGDYTLTATTSGTGSNAAFPGLVSFLDTSNNNFVLATAALGTPVPAINFLNSANPVAGGVPDFIAVGDFNNDGKLDMAVANEGILDNNSSVSIFLGNGDGTFITEPQIPIGALAYSIAVSDFNGDGNADLAVVSINGSVVILLGHGDGTFAQGTNIPFTYFPYTLAVGDFNGDGNADLAVTAENTSTVAILLGNGDGTFTAAPMTATAGDGDPYIAVGDFNGDGKQDLAVTNETTSTVNILLGNGDGSFTAAASPATGVGPVFVAVADFNGDGKQDLAVANEDNGTLTILLGNGDGTFTATPASPGAGADPSSIVVEDFNGDGIPDLAVSNFNSTYATLLLGNGDGSFTASTNAPTDQYVFTIGAGDFNGDGVPDLAGPLYNPSNPAIGNTVTVLLTQLSASATATANGVSPAGTGVDQVRASYPGAGTYGASLSPTIGLDDQLVATTLAVTAAPASAPYGQGVVLSANLTPSTAQGYGTDGETVTFYNGNVSLGPGTLNGGVARIIVQTLGVGTNNLTAVYPGDADFAASTSPALPYRGLPGDPPVSVGTTTNLTLSAATVAAGTVVTLTAAVTSGPTEVYPGQVNFCDATAAFCTDIHRLGTAQLTANGTATLSFVPGIGTYSYQAVFAGTSSDAASTSAAQTLTVTGTVPTQTTITPSGFAGHYRLTGTVVETGDGLAPPAGLVTFTDATNGNSPLGNATLGAGIPGLSFLASYSGPTGVNPQTIATGDFNGDGIADLIFANGNDNTLTVLLGQGNGTFVAAPTVNTPADPFSMAVGDFNGDGKLDLAITDVNDDEITILLGGGDGTFTLAGSYETPGRPVSVAVGDFNGDGVQDLVVAQSNTTTLIILLGNGDGTFNPGNDVQEPGNSPPYSVTVADFNGDGKADLALANFVGSNVTILLGNGDGTFTATNATYPTGGEPFFLVSGDFNGDGIPDLATANFADSTLTILLGGGDGTFTAAASVPTGSGPSSITIADFNGDGKPDLAVAGFFSDVVNVLLGNGDGTFTDSGADIATAGEPSFAAAADFNGDGVPDIAISNGNLNNTALMLSQRTQTASATLANVSPIGTGNHAVFATFAGSGNLNGSNSEMANLLVPPPSNLSLTITATGNTPGTVTAGTAITLTAGVSTQQGPVSPGTVTFCDATAALCENSAILGTAQLTSAGAATLVLVPGIGTHSYNAVFAGTPAAAGGTSPTETVTVTGLYPTQSTITATGTAGNYTLTGSVVGIGSTSAAPTGNLSFLDATNNNFSLGTAVLGAGTAGLSFFNSSNPLSGNNAQSVSTGDFNGDGLADLVIANGNDNTLTVLLSNGDGTFTTVASAPSTGANPTLRAVGDLNGDGKADLAVADVYGGSLTILLGNGDGTFTPAARQPEVAEPISVAIGDFNGDGIPDLAVANYSTASVTILLGNGDGTFIQAEANPPAGASPYSIVTADFNRDGIPDLAVANYVDKNVTILLGNGDGTFTAAPSPASGDATFYITTGDFNGDGNPDLAVVNNGDSNVTILLGNGDGTFTPAASPATGQFPQGAVVADFNGDGKADLAVVNYLGMVTILFGNGDGTFTAAATSPATAGNAAGIATGDFNGDGVPDLAVANGTNNQASVLLTQRTQTATAVLQNVNPKGTGIHNVDASYPSDGTFGISTSPTTGITATLPPALIQASIAGGSSVAYGPLSVTVTLSGTGQGAPVPTGSIFYFLDNFTNAIPVSGTLTNGSITFTLPQIALGSHFIDFSYSGDTNYAATPNNIPPASLAVPFSVIPAPDTIAIAVTPNPVRTPNPVSMTATLTSAATGATGTVTFLDGATSLGQAPLIAAGTATLNGIALAVGPHTLTAVYSGDQNFISETSPPVSLTVEALAVQLTSIAPTLATAGAADTPIVARGQNFTPSAVVTFNGTPLATTFVSATQLQAIIPAALLATVENVTVTVTDTYSVSTSLPASFAVLPPVAATLSGPPTTDPGAQPALTFQLQQAFPTDLAGVMTLTFTPAAGSPDNPEVQFATGGRTFNFTLAANTTTTPAILLQAGTVSGTIGITLQLTSSGVNVTPAAIQPIAIAVPPVAPTVTTVTFSASGTTLTVLVSGYSSTREIQQGTFTFTPMSGVTLASQSVTIPATALFQTWYSDTDSAQYGSSFTYTQTFTLSGMASQITGVGVTLTNSEGTSIEVSSQ